MFTNLVTKLFNFRLAGEIFKDHPGQSGDTGGDGGGKKRKGGGKTVSSFYKEQLASLMTTLHSTEPHFIRYFRFLNVYHLFTTIAFELLNDNHNY